MTTLVLGRLLDRLRRPPTVSTRSGRVFVVFNPEAGHFERHELLIGLRDRFRAAKCRYAFYEMTRRENVAQVVRQAIDDGYTMIVAAGGDGTISAVASGIVGSQVPLGIIPVGTGNALARELGIPLKLYKALDLIVGEHAVRSIDAMQVRERYFLLVVGIGVSSAVVESTRQEAKLLFGRLAYFLQIFKQFLGFQPYRFRITVDGRVVDVRASEVLIANTSRVGGSPFHWARNVRPDDGELAVCVMRLPSFSACVGVCWNMLFNRQHRGQGIRWYGARSEATIECRYPLRVQADGELIGQIPVTVRVVPAAIQVIVPPFMC